MRALMTTSDRLGALIATGAGKRAGGTLSKARVAADWENEGFSQPHGPHILQGLITGNQIQNRNFSTGVSEGCQPNQMSFGLGPTGLIGFR